MFRKVVGEIVRAFSTVDEKLALANSVTNPIKTHIHCFGASLFYGVVCDAGGAGVVGLDGGCCLRVSHVAERVAEHGDLLSVKE